MGSDGASVPVEHVIALVVAMRDHVLACAPAAMPDGTPGNATKNGKRKKKGDAQPQASGTQVVALSYPSEVHIIQAERHECYRVGMLIALLSMLIACRGFVLACPRSSSSTKPCRSASLTRESGCEVTRLAPS